MDYRRECLKVFNHLKIKVLRTIPFGQITTIDDDEAIKEHVCHHPLHEIVLNAGKCNCSCNLRGQWEYEMIV